MSRLFLVDATLACIRSWRFAKSGGRLVLPDLGDVIVFCLVFAALSLFCDVILLGNVIENYYFIQKNCAVTNLFRHPLNRNEVNFGICFKRNTETFDFCLEKCHRIFKRRKKDRFNASHILRFKRRFLLLDS